MTRILRWGVTLLLAVLVAAGNGAQAHDARPVAVTIEEITPGLFHWSMRVPPSVEADNQPLVVWPADCKPVQGDKAGAALVACTDDLTGQQLSLRFPLFNPSLGLFYRLTRLQGGVVNAMLSPTDGAWIVPAPMTPTRVAKDYTLLGIEHIVTGYDHLLFVFGLLVIARSARRILLTVTGFTLAHSMLLERKAEEYSLALPKSPSSTFSGQSTRSSPRRETSPQSAARSRRSTRTKRRSSPSMS